MLTVEGFIVCLRQVNDANIFREIHEDIHPGRKREKTPTFMIAKDLQDTFWFPYPSHLIAKNAKKIGQFHKRKQN